MEHTGFGRWLVFTIRTFGIMLTVPRASLNVAETRRVGSGGSWGGRCCVSCQSDPGKCQPVWGPVTSPTWRLCGSAPCREPCTLKARGTSTHFGDVTLISSWKRLLVPELVCHFVTDIYQGTWALLRDWALFLYKAEAMQRDYTPSTTPTASILSLPHIFHFQVPVVLRSAIIVSLFLA